jgi:hypothetical protein
MIRRQHWERQSVAFLGNRADSRIARPICEAQFGGKAGYDHEEFTGDYEHAGGSFGANDGLELCIFSDLHSMTDHDWLGDSDWFGDPRLRCDFIG